MKRQILIRFLKAVALTGVAAAVSSCAFFGRPAPDDVDAAMVAGAVLDYTASESYEQVQELELAGETYDLSGGAGGGQSQRAVTTETVTREFPNVTYTIVRELDDQDTDTPTDDVLTVTRTADYGFEASYIQVTVRPLKPTTSSEWESYTLGSETIGWAGDPLDVIVQNGTAERRIDAVTMANGTIKATWRRAAGTVYAEQIVRETTRVATPNVIRRTIISQEQSGATSLTRERVVDGEVVETLTVEPWVDPDTGETYTRITRDDGGYAIVRQEGNRRGEPRIVDYYSADDVLFLTVEEVTSAARGTIESTRTRYDADGNVTSERTVTYSINYMEGDEDRVQVTRTDGTRTRTVTITEDGEVYLVTLNGEEYRVRVVDADTVEFLDDAGNVIMTAERQPDGTWLLVRGGEAITV